LGILASRSEDLRISGSQDLRISGSQDIRGSEDLADLGVGLDLADLADLGVGVGILTDLGSDLSLPLIYTFTRARGREKTILEVRYIWPFKLRKGN